MGKIAKDYGDREPGHGKGPTWEAWIADFDDDDQAVIHRWIDSKGSGQEVIRLIEEATGKRWSHATISRLRLARRG